jgi:peptidyl-prolyl cis-trans isomerase SurA
VHDRRPAAGSTAAHCPGVTRIGARLEPVRPELCYIVDAMSHVGRRGLLAICCAAAIAGGSLAMARPAHASVIERVVAVVGEDSILLSEIRIRARPMLLRIQAQVPPGAQRNAAISQAYVAVLERLIEEQLKTRSARKSQIHITPAEVDRALDRVAKQNGLTRATLLAEAARTGMSEAEYREEIRQQLLEMKLLELRLQGRLRITDQDAKSAYRRLVLAGRAEADTKLAWLVVSAEGTGVGAIAKARARAEQLAIRARAGADFAQLARTESDDPTTKHLGGLLGTVRPTQLPPGLDHGVTGLDVGEVSAPLRIGSRFVVLKVLERTAAPIPEYEAAEAQLKERVYMEKMDEARKQWLDGLRRQTHVETRL